MLLDERSFENEGFDFIVGDNELHIGDLSDEFFCFNAVGEFAGAAGLKIRTDTVAQVLGLADVNDFSRRVFVQIYAWRARNFFKLFVQSHCLINLPQRHRDTEKANDLTRTQGNAAVISIDYLRVSVPLWQTNLEYDS